MTHQDRHVRIGDRPLGRERLRKRQVGGQRQYPGEPVREPQTGCQRDRAALRETGEHDSRCRDTARNLVAQVSVHAPDRLREPRRIRASLRRERPDVVPGPHHVASVHRHRSQAAHAGRRSGPASVSGSRSSSTIGTKSVPSAPSPCSSTTLATAGTRRLERHFVPGLPLCVLHASAHQQQRLSPARAPPACRRARRRRLRAGLSRVRVAGRRCRRDGAR